MTISTTATIILAAGASTRLGRPKQLLRFKGKTLLQHVLDEAGKAKPGPILIVTGAYASEIKHSIETDALIVFNENWPHGMGSGIAAGIKTLAEIYPSCPQAIISVCDQPYLSASLFHEMIEKQAATGKGIVACAYGETVGVPVLFTKTYFEHLLSLQGDSGAKPLLKSYVEDVATVAFDQGIVDVDRESDLEKLEAQ